MAIKIIGSTIIDDSRNTVNAGIATVTSVSIGNTQVISSARQLQNIASLDATTTATIESAIANAPNTFTDLSVSGVSTLGVTSTTNLTAQQLNVSGVSTLGTVQILSGIVTATSGVVTYYGDGSKLTDIQVSSIVGVVSYADSAGIATYATSSGIATYASTAGASTSLQNSRTFEITGDIVASPISFNGTGNVSLSATIQPNSVALGSDTTGDYVTNITGTSNQITVTSGTGEGSTPTLSIPNQFTAPQDVTVTRDLQVDRNLNVNGNITIGGTSATLFTTEFKVYDPDIVLGVRTDAFGNDVSTDNTANHGGIAIASTEGTPLISLYDVGIGETNPATYKKFMWFKSGTFSGLGTDAWISNYAIGIGSTQVPNGVRLAAGAINVLDNKLNVSGDIDFSGTFYQNGSPFVASRWTAGTGDNIYRLNGNVGIATTNPQSALDVRGAITVGVGTVGINSVFSTTDIQSWYYTNKSFASGSTSPQGIYVGAAGTQMFVVSNTSPADTILQYPLSIPYDISTAGAATTFFPTATQETVPTGIDFHPNGTKMFICGQTGVNPPLVAGGEYVHEYSLSTPWNVAPSSVGYTTSYQVTTQEGSPTAVAIGAAGTAMYVVGTSNDTVYQYTLTTPYSLAAGNVTYTGKTLGINVAPLSEGLPNDISFNSTGTVLWIVGSTNDRIYEFRLGTAWDISTAVFYDDVYIGFNELSLNGLHVIPEQNVAYIVGSTNNTVYQYSTNTPALEISSSGISSESSIVLNNETRVKDKLYVKGLAHFDNNIVTQGNLTVDGGSTLTGGVTASGALTVSGTLTVSGGTITAGNVTSSLLTGNTSTTISFGTALTSGGLVVGGTAQTGTMTIDRSTSAHILDIASGANATGVGKTVNIATGGASGSRTLVTVGSATAGAASTVTIPSPTNLLIGTATTTGTASQPLQVSGGAYVSGNLGVGATNPASNTQVAIAGTLGISEVGGAGTRTLLSSSGSGFVLNHNDNSNINIQSQGSNRLAYQFSNNSWTIPAGGTALLIGTGATTGTASQPLQVSGGAYVSGSVGIGVTNPQDELHLGGTSNVGIRLEDTAPAGGSYATIGYNDNGSGTNALSLSADAGNTGANSEIRFSIDGNDVSKYAVGGELLVGAATTTGTSSQKLQVTGGAYVSGNLGVGVTNPGATLNVVPTSTGIAGLFSGTTSSDMVRITQLGTGNALVVEDETNPDTSSFVIANDGKVGIGITNPGHKLVISGGLVGTSQVRFVNSGSGDLYINHSNLVSSLQAAANIQLALGSNNVEVVRINTSGFVGIGTTNPTSALTVQGDVRVSGVVTATEFSGNASSATYATTAGIATYATTAGVSTNATYATSSGIATYATTAGIATYATSSGIATSVIGGIGSITQLQVTGISTFTNGPIFIGAATSTGTASQRLQVTGGGYFSDSVGIGTTNPSDALTVLGKVQIQQDSGSNNRLVFRAKQGNAYRWNIDNDSTNNFRIFREDDATAANGVVYLGISTTGTVSATRFSGDGSLLTGITASGSGVAIQNQGSNVGTATTINFSTNLTASFSSGTATISLSNNPSISGILTADQVYTSNNGNGQNVRIGDDFWLGDVNVADTTRFSGAQDSTRAFVIFGSSDAVSLGRTGTGPLYYGGNFNVAGIATATSFSGSGTNLTGIVTSITAGSGISVNQSTGNVTITSTGGASLDILEVMLFA
jgi:hypothetical protein